VRHEVLPGQFGERVAAQVGDQLRIPAEQCEGHRGVPGRAAGDDLLGQRRLLLVDAHRACDAVNQVDGGQADEHALLPCHPGVMCRNIRTLHNFDPPATNDEVHAAALQYVRKVSGSTRPSAANQEVFDRAVEEVAHITRHLLADLVTSAPPKDRETEAAKARARAEQRYGRVAG
jgi:hypothetical protein